MKKIKKILALTLSLLMLISALPLTAGAAEEEVIQWKASNTQTVDPELYYTIILENGSISTNNSDIGSVYTVGVIFDEHTDRFVMYNVTPSYTGTYLVEVEAATNEMKPNYLHAYADDVEIGTLYIADGGWVNYTEGFRKIGTVTAEAGKPIKLAFNNPKTDINSAVAMICLNQIRLTYLTPAEFETASIEDGSTVARSTDSITLDFSRELDDEKIEEAKVSLTDADSNELSLTLEADGDKLNVLLNETLKYDESYTLTFSDIKDTLGTSTAKETISFTTAAKESDSSTDNASVSIIADVEDTTFTINATVYGSKGQPIAGRQVKVSVTSPKGDDTQVIGTETSDKNGKVSLTYELPEEYTEISGQYIFEAEAEHALESASDTSRYISVAKKQILLGTLEDKETSGEVKAFFAEGTNATDLGADMASLLELADDEFFYDRLAKASYKNEKGEYDIKVFEKVWDISYALENIYLSDDDAVTSSYLEDEFFISQTGFDTKKYQLLDTEREEFVSSVTALKRMETAEDFGIATDALLNQYILKEKGITTPELSINDVSVYKGQVAEIDLTLSKATDGVKEYTVTVICPSKDVASDVTLEAPSGCNAQRKQDEAKVIFTVSGVDESLSALGTLNTSPSSNAILKVSAGMVYDIDGVYIPSELSEVSAEVDVKSNNNKGGSSSTSGVSFGGSSKPLQNTPQVTPNTSAVSTSIFADLGSVSWAEDNIMNLYNKGIISKAEDGKFRPNDSITRAEFVKMLVTALGIKGTSARVSLSDVTAGDWYYGYVAAAVENGLVLGDDKGNFRPNDRITRQDICVIISRAMDSLGYREEASDTALFYDDMQISDYAKKAVYRMRAHEIVNGTGDGGFAPLSDATRAATAKIIDTFMKEANI